MYLTEDECNEEGLKQSVINDLEEVSQEVFEEEPE